MKPQEDSLLSEVEDFLASFDLPTLRPVATSSDVPDVTKTIKGKTQSKRLRCRASASQRHKMYRKHQRTERQHLERGVQELTKILNSTRAKFLTVSAWRTVAHRLLMARLQAEAQRTRLRLLVSTQSTLITEYQKMVHPQTISEPKAFDLEFYRVYVHKLDVMYAQTNAIFGNTLKIQSDFATTKWEEDRTKGFYQLRSQDKVTSDFGKACEALWSIAELPHRTKTYQVFDGVGDANNTVAFKFRILVPEANAAVLQRFITRRYQQDNRMVLIWQHFAEGEGHFSGIHAEHVGWGQIIRSEATTVLQNCMRCIPM